MDEERPHPKSSDVVIWDVEPEQTTSIYWVRTHGRGGATHLFEGPDALAKARSAAHAIAGPEGTVWMRYKDGHFEKLDKS